ncbi:hypothetical protein SISSUDRAFT_1036781 [Sistotremastrum suecicum HHB10207 ss-3]|uniref:Uncharacterized protein n=1 Tax=Sistotremastrum suecicum HHB10207 ss-3 TaxID=1314776 RepID=A0A165Z0Z7_9AGAM|nr:hypothetical protein SISSUDRAFT_1036781 [Sistotremastrum suecicum HHB10207 ss-3]
MIGSIIMIIDIRIAMRTVAEPVVGIRNGKPGKLGSHESATALEVVETRTEVVHPQRDRKRPNYHSSIKLSRQGGQARVFLHGRGGKLTRVQLDTPDNDDNPNAQRIQISTIPPPSVLPDEPSIPTHREDVVSQHPSAKHPSHRASSLSRSFGVNSADTDELLDSAKLLKPRHQIKSKYRRDSEGGEKVFVQFLLGKAVLPAEYGIPCMMSKDGPQLSLEIGSAEMELLTFRRQVISPLSPHSSNESRHGSPAPFLASERRASVPPERVLSPPFIILDPKFPGRSDPKSYTRTYKSTRQSQKSSYTLWRENGALDLGPLIRANRIGPRVDGAQPGDLYEINYGENVAVWAMHKDEWCSITTGDQHPVLGQYVLHYRPDGTGPSWVLRETLQKYQKQTGGKGDI